MKKKNHTLATVSFVLGLASLLLAIRRPGPLMILAVPLGLAAACAGLIASWMIFRARASRGGHRFAILGGCFGTLGAVVSIMTMTAVFQKQFNQHDMRSALAANRMPRESTTNFNFNLPVIVLRGDTGDISKESSTLVRAEFFEGGKWRSAETSKADYQGLVAIHLRGNTSMHAPKQSYTLHTLDGKTNQIKVPLLGLPPGEDWVLYAPFEDKSMIRDVLAYELAAKMGHYAPRTRYVELFLAGSTGEISMRDYLGVYVLIEKIKRGHDRVNIAKLSPEDRSEPNITGGYIVKRDHDDRNAKRFRTNSGGPYFYVYPNERDITPQQRSWLVHYFNAFESALYGDAFKDPKKGYAAYLDVDSFIDAHWLIELGRNVDGFRYSSFITKDRGGKLKTEPPWDWNRAFGNANYYDGWQTQGWYWPRLRPNEISWYRKLREDPEFVGRSKKRWAELRRDVFDPKKIDARIDELAAQLAGAQERNFTRWPILGQSITCNYFVGNSYQEEVNWLKKWIEKRIAWIDSQTQGPENSKQ